MYTETFSTSTSDEILDELKNLKLSENEVNVVSDFIKQIENDNDNTPWYYLKRQCLPKEIRKKSLRYALAKELERIPTLTDIQAFKFTLETSPLIEVGDDNQKRISYGNFLEVLSKSSSLIQNFFKPATLFGESISYLDDLGRLGTDVIIQFLILKSNLFSFRVKLAKYDEKCVGQLNREQMIEFLNNEVFTTVSSLMDMEETFREYYRKTVLSLFFFFLDYKNFGRCRISDIIVSGFIENIFLHQNNEENGGSRYENWFSPDKTQVLFSTFQMLDEEGKGFLTKENFARISDGAYTSAFIDRLFEVHVAKKGTEMSYDEFIVFQIAQDHLAHPAAMNYFFKVLDMDEDGYLTLFELSYFYKHLKSAYCNYVADADAMPEFYDYSDMMFDMVNPKDDERISLNDVVNCKQGHEFILNLINHFEFYRFEHKESDSGSDDSDDNLDSILPDNEEVEPAQ